MKKYILSLKSIAISLYLLLGLTQTSLAQPGINQNKDYWSNRILNDVSLPEVRKAAEQNNYNIYSNVSAIHPDLLKLLKTWHSESVLFANPNMKYNSTDCVDESLPNRQLIKIFSNENYTFILYNHGGIAFHKHLIWCKLSSKRINDVWICNYFEDISTIQELKRFLKKILTYTYFKEWREV
jgi:hypothetical protein